MLVDATFFLILALSAPEGNALSLQTVIDSALAGPQDGLAAQANADLLLSCFQGSAAPAEQLAQTLSQILGYSPIATDQDGHSVEDNNAIITGRQEYSHSSIPANPIGNVCKMRITYLCQHMA